MPDYSRTRSEYLKIMYGDRQGGIDSLKPEQVNDVNTTSFDAASLSDEQIDGFIASYKNSQVASSDAFKSVEAEKQKREGDKADKSGWERFTDFWNDIGTSISEGLFNAVDQVWDFGNMLVGGFAGGWRGDTNGVTEWTQKASQYDWVAQATKGATMASRAAFGIFNLADPKIYKSDYWTTWDPESIRKEMAQSKDVTGNEGMDNFGWQAGNFIGEMLPSIALGIATGGASFGAQVAAQAALAGATGAGRGFSQATKEGASFGKASLYGGAEGAVSAAIAGPTYGIGGSAANKASTGVTGKIGGMFAKVVSKATKNGTVQHLAGVFGEGLARAGIASLTAAGQTALEPVIKSVYDNGAAYDYAYTHGHIGKQICDSMVQAAAVSAVFTAAREVGTRVKAGTKQRYNDQYFERLAVAGVDQKSLDVADAERRQIQKNMAKELGFTDIREEADPNDVLSKKMDATWFKTHSNDDYSKILSKYSQQMQAWSDKYSPLFSKTVNVLNSNILDNPSKDVVANAQSGIRGSVSSLSDEAANFTTSKKIVGEFLKQYSFGNDATTEGGNVSSGAQVIKATDNLMIEYDPKGASVYFSNPSSQSGTKIAGAVVNGAVVFTPGDHSQLIESLGMISNEANLGKVPTQIALPVKSDISSKPIIVDTANMSKSELDALASVKPEQIVEDGGIKYAPVGENKILVFNGNNNGVVQLSANKDKDGKLLGYSYKVGDKEIKYEKTIKDTAFYKGLSVEDKAIADKIEANKHLSGILSYSKFSTLGHDELSLLSAGADLKGMTLEEVLKVPAIKKAEDFVASLPKLEAESNADLVRKVGEESLKAIIDDGKNLPAPKGKMPQLLIVIGIPGAGKSATGIKKFIEDNGAVEDDNDVFKAVPSLAKEYRGGLGANRVQDIVSAAQVEVVNEYLFSHRYNVAYPMVGKRVKSVAQVVAQAKKHGYHVTLKYQPGEVDVSRVRIATRYLQEGRFVSEMYLDSVGSHKNEKREGTENLVDKTWLEIHNRNDDKTPGSEGLVTYEGKQYQIDDYGRGEDSQGSQDSRGTQLRGSGSAQNQGREEERPDGRGPVVSGGPEHNLGSPLASVHEGLSASLSAVDSQEKFNAFAGIDSLIAEGSEGEVLPKSGGDVLTKYDGAIKDYKGDMPITGSIIRNLTFDFAGAFDDGEGGRSHSYLQLQETCSDVQDELETMTTSLNDREDLSDEDFKRAASLYAYLNSQSGSDAVDAMASDVQDYYDTASEWADEHNRDFDKDEFIDDFTEYLDDFKSSFEDYVDDKYGYDLENYKPEAPEAVEPEIAVATAPAGGNDNEFGRVQTASEGLSGEEKALFRSGSKRLDSEQLGLLRRVLSEEIKSREHGRDFDEHVALTASVSVDGVQSTNEFKIIKGVSPETFHDVFSVVKPYIAYNEFVDLHPAKTTAEGAGYDKATCYLSEDGFSGFAIEDGNLISVFNLGEKRGFIKAIKDYVVSEGANRLDCYASSKNGDENLPLIYQKKLGFSVASMMDWNPDYDHDQIGANHDSPSVAFMVYDPEGKLGVTEKHFGKNDYDAAQAYQLSFLSPKKEPEPVQTEKLSPIVERNMESRAELVKDSGELRKDAVIKLIEAQKVAQAVMGSLETLRAADGVKGKALDGRELFVAVNLGTPKDIEKAVGNLVKQAMGTDLVFDKGTAMESESNSRSADPDNSFAWALTRKACDVLSSVGKQGEMSKAVDQFNRQMANLRARTETVNHARKKYESLANSFDSTRSILSKVSDIDASMVDVYRGLVKGFKVSRRGWTISPLYLNDTLLKAGSAYTSEAFSGSVIGFNPEIKRILDGFAERHPDGVDPNSELPVGDQIEVTNLFDAIAHDMSEQRALKLQRQTEKAEKGVTLARIAKRSAPVKKYGPLGAYKDSALNFPKYLETYLGREHPFTRQMTAGWEKAENSRLKTSMGLTGQIEEILDEGKVKTSFFSKKVSFKGANLTKGQIASAIFTVETRPDIIGKNHLTFRDDESHTSVRLAIDGQEDVDAMKSLLSENELAALTRIRNEVLDGTARDLFMEWHRETFGFSPRVEDNYFGTQTESDAISLSDNSLESRNYLTGAAWGRAKERVNHSKDFRIMEFFGQVEQYVDDISFRVGYTQYLDDTRIMLNKKVGGESLNMVLGQFAPDWNSGVSWRRYMTHILLNDRSYDTGGRVGSLFGNMQAAVLGLNLGPILRQPLSSFTVMGRVGAEAYFQSVPRMAYDASHVGAVNELIKKYVPIYKDRVENHGLVKGKLSREAVNSIQKVCLFLMEKTDQLNNISSVWPVAETLAKQEGFAYGTEANYERAAEHFVDLLLWTQSNNNAMFVSPLRSGYVGQANKMLWGMFGSDNQNKAQQVDGLTFEYAAADKRAEQYKKTMADDTASDAEKEAAKEAYESWESNYSGKARRKAYVGVLAGLIASGIGSVLVTELTSRVYGKKEWTEFDSADFAKTAALEAFVNWVPYIGTLANAIENNSDVSFFTADRISAVVSAVSDVISAANSGDEGKIRGAVGTFVRNFSEWFGIPANNVYKLLKGILKNVDEDAYMKTFGWLDGMSSDKMGESYSANLKAGNLSDATSDLMNIYALYKTGAIDRAVGLEEARLASAGYTTVVAKSVPSYYADETGEAVYLTNEQKVRFASLYKESNAVVSEIVSSSGYSGLGDEEKAKVIKKTYDAYYEYAKYGSLGMEPNSKLGLLLAYSGGDVDVAMHLMLIQRTSEMADTRTKTRKQQVVSLVNGTQGLSKGAKLLSLLLIGYKPSEESKGVLANYLISIGFKKKEALDFIG